MSWETSTVPYYICNLVYFKWFISKYINIYQGFFFFFLIFSVVRWSAIAARLPGRTDNEIKNYWNTHIRKRMLRMGIDPVTHSPRLDLLDLSSILGSSLCNPALLNLSSLLSSTTQALFNPEFLRLASTILSLKQENPEFLSQHNKNLQEHQLLFHIQQLQNQLVPSLQLNIQDNHDQFQNPIQESGFLTAQMTTQAPINVDHHQGSSSNKMPITNLATQENNVGTSSTINPSSTLAENLVADYLPETSYFQNLLDYSNKDFSFDSVISTPSSSPTPLNSSSMTNVNSGAEDERESFCSNLLKFEIPESLDISDYL